MSDSFGNCDPSTMCTSNKNDIIIARLDAASRVVWATQIGSDTEDVPGTILIHDNLILVASTTTSSFSAFSTAESKAHGSNSEIWCSSSSLDIQQ